MLKTSADLDTHGMMDKSPTPESNASASANRSGEDQVLSGDELRYLRALFATGEPEESDLTEVGLLASNETLLELLPGLKGLQASAEQGDYHYVFPLESVHSSSLKLRLQTPRIYDTRGTARSWRAPVKPGEIEVTDPSGSLRRPQVKDISASGLFLSADAEDAYSVTKQHAGIRLSLKVPDLSSPFVVKGRVVRCSFDEARSRQWLGVKFVAPDQELEEAIHSYLFRVHCALRADETEKGREMSATKRKPGATPLA